MNKKWIVTAAAVILLAGCSKGASGGSSSAYSGSYYAAETAAYDSEAGYGYMNGMMEEAEYAQEEKSSDPVLTGEKLVYRGSLTVETLNYAETVKSVREKVAQYQGIIESEYESDNDRSWYNSNASRGTSSLNMTVRIPTEHFQEFMNDMDGSGKITSRSTNVENISRTYADNATVIEALQKQEKRLLEMMDAAETIEDMIAVEDRLTEVQTELNRKLSYQNSMDTDVKYSTISLYINEVVEYTPDPDIERRGTFAYRLENTLKSTWRDFLYTLESLLFLIIRLIPYIVVFVPLFFALRWLWRKLPHKGKGIGFRKKKSDVHDEEIDKL